MKNIEAMAGETSDISFERDLAACVAELRPVVLKIMKDGHTPNAVIAALGQLTVYTVTPEMIQLDS